MSSKKIETVNKTKKIAILFFIIFFFLFILVVSVFRTISEKRDLPSLRSEKSELSVRGDIISADNFKIATSKKLYTASIDSRYLDPQKEGIIFKLIFYL